MSNSHSQAITNFASVMSALRDDLSTTESEIGELQAERTRVENAQSHTDDLVANFLRGHAKAERDYKDRLKVALSSMFVRDLPREANLNAARTVKERPQDLLQISAVGGDSRDPILSSTNGLFYLDIAAVNYFLRRNMADDLPQLIDELCPQARNGVKEADRALKLAAIDEKLSALQRKRDDLKAEIEAGQLAPYQKADGSAEAVHFRNAQPSDGAVTLVPKS